MKGHRFTGGLLGLILILGGCSYIPLFNQNSLNTSVKITETRRTIVFEPTETSPAPTGLLFYPGGLVDSHVYSELLAQFSQRAGVTVVLAKMPGNLAVFDSDGGLAVIKDHPSLKKWAIAGHSLGGAMAAATVKRNPQVYEGLIFMDSYPADGDSLKEWPGVILSLFSSLEKVSDSERMEKTLSLIPPATWISAPDSGYPAADSNYSVLHQIDGGSHSYFGTYGPQDGDVTPTISRSLFHQEVVDYMMGFFTEQGWR